MPLRSSFVIIACCVLGFVLTPSSKLWAKPSSCEECHVKLTPKQVQDFNRGTMAETMTCAGCHGDAHQSADDVDKALLPTVATCQECHEEQVAQHQSGKHAMGLLSVEAMPYTHGQPVAFTEGRKGCGGCHPQGVVDQKARQTKARKHYKYGMDCQTCHTRHMFSKAEAAQPEACMTCHMGFDHAQWEMYSSSKHGVIYMINRVVDPKNANRAPTCQVCHMPGGDHRVFSAWGFLAVRLPEQDEEWMGYRATILKALGVLDPSGKPTGRLDAVKAAKMARLTGEEFKAERQRYTATCEQCHSKTFVEQNFANADQMVKEADKLMAQAIEVVADLYKTGVIKPQKDQATYPDLLAFYNVNTKVEQVLYEMFMDHRMKTFQGAFHNSPDYVTWYGFAKMNKDLTEIRELAKQMKAGSGKK